MDFKFNFAVEEDSSVASSGLDLSEDTAQSQSVSKTKQGAIPAKLLKLRLPETNSCSSRGFTDVVIGTQNFKLAGATRNCESDVTRIAAQVDVLPGSYEGGFKVWECTHDLIKYLQESWENQGECKEVTQVLDLGCGRGLCGVSVLMRCTNSTVTFQDLNEEVLVEQTMLNALGSTDRHTVDSRCRFLSGDWAFAKCELGEDRYDLILTAETVYAPDGFADLADIFVRSLKRNSRSRVLLSAKKYYFGLGGGTDGFKAFIQRHETYRTLLEATVVRSIDDGQSNIREILELKRKC